MEYYEEDPSIDEDSMMKMEACKRDFEREIEHASIKIKNFEKWLAVAESLLKGNNIPVKTSSIKKVVGTAYVRLVMAKINKEKLVTEFEEESNNG